LLEGSEKVCLCISTEFKANVAGPESLLLKKLKIKEIIRIIIIQTA
jgi:hypothetical protein